VTSRRVVVGSVALLATAFAAPLAAVSDEEVKTISTRPGVTQSFLLLPPAAPPLASVILFTATFLFRQFYLTVPDEPAEAAQLDGVGPLRFFWSFLLPLSWTNVAALFVVLFIYGWNQYLWPLMITNTEAMRVVVIGLQDLIPRTGTHVPGWNIMMAAAMVALLPPVAVILLMQRWFVKGLVGSEK